MLENCRFAPFMAFMVCLLTHEKVKLTPGVEVNIRAGSGKMVSSRAGEPYLFQKAYTFLKNI